MKVYLAGKIWSNDWRHDIFPDLRKYEGYRQEGSEQRNKQIDLLKRGSFEYVGPFFMSDDHGSYHGKGKHGRAAGMNENQMYPDKKPESSKTVVKKCFEWIDKSDFLFVWLNKQDAYGTIVEIGYAKAKNKIIFLVIDQSLVNTNFTQDIWFARAMADYVCFEESAEKGWEKFEEKFAINSDTPFSYIVKKQDRTWINTKISEFTNRLARKHSVEELNDYDRRVLTALFMSETPLQYRSFNDFMDDGRLLQDIMEEIDYKIVRGYHKYKTNKEAIHLQTWEIEGTGLIYQFKKNYEKESLSNREKEKNKLRVLSSASINQINYLEVLLKKNCYELTIPNSALNGNQASILIGHFVEGKTLDDENKKLLKEQNPREFSGTMKASGIVDRLKRVFVEENDMKVTVPLHTKCKNYFTDIKLLNEETLDETYVVLNEQGDFEYTSKWLHLLVETLSDKEKYAALKKYKKGNLK